MIDNDILFWILMNGKDYYYHESLSTSDEVRYITQQKFPGKVKMDV